MKYHELLRWAFLLTWVACACCLAAIGFRNSAWWGPRRSVFKELRPLGIRLGKIAGLLFVAGVVFFLMGALI